MTQQNDDWGGAIEPGVTKQAMQHKQERFNRKFDLGVGLLYFLIIAIVVYWRPADLGAKDVLSLVTPVIFYLLGIHKGNSKS
jgi:hypothetical protein